MRKILFILVLMVSVGVNGQNLYQGVYTIKTLLTDAYIGYPQPNGCYNYEYDLPTFPSMTYVQGMQLGIKIDSIKGADSIRVWYAPNFLYVFLKSNDTIPIISNSSNIFWCFSSIDTLYTSLIAYGIPQIQNQRYYCNYGKQLYYPMADGCGNFYSLLFEGNFLGDTTHNCEVLPNPLPSNSSPSLHKKKTIMCCYIGKLPTR